MYTTGMTDIPPETIGRFRSHLLEWSENNLREYPWRESDRSLYEVFIAEFFLTQTPADNVATVYPEFLNRFSTLEHIRDASLSELEDAIEPLGFQRMRAEALKQIAAENDTLPCDPTTLADLPRVGPYVSSATVCVACEERVPILDRNVRRVYERIFGGQYPEEPTAEEQFAESALPEDGSTTRTYNLALVDFGALVCTKRSPRCSECFASEYCDYFQSMKSD